MTDAIILTSLLDSGAATVYASHSDFGRCEGWSPTINGTVLYGRRGVT